MSEEIVSYGIDINYVKDWTVDKAVTEIYQNFIDFGNFETTFDKDYAEIANDFAPEMLDFMLLGKSIKHNEHSIGKHGEGLKLAMLVLYRNNIPCSLCFVNRDETEIISIYPTTVSTAFGESFGVVVDKIQQLTNIGKHKFSVFITGINDTVKEISDSILPAEAIDGIGYHGKVLKDGIKGNIYYGRLLFTYKKDIPYSIILNPKNLRVDRDRRIIGEFDLSYAISNMKHEDVDVDTINNSEWLNYVGKSYFQNANIEAKQNGTNIDVYVDKKKIENQHIASIIKKEVIPDKVSKMMFIQSKKKTPYSILFEFEEKFSYKMEKDTLEYLKNIINKSKEWAVRG